MSRAETFSRDTGLGMRKSKLYVVGALSALVVVAAAISLGRLYLAQLTAEEPVPAAPASVPPIGGPFSLVDHTGRAVTDRDFRGQFMLVFFGYTYCPDLCPVELQYISEAMDALGEAGTKVRPVFITVDPEHDTVEVMADYLSNFHPRLVGLTGTPEQIAAAAKAYLVYYAKFYPAPAALGGETDGGENASDYLMDHSTFTYLMGPDGRYLAHFSYGTPPEAMAEEIRRYLR